MKITFETNFLPLIHDDRDIPEGVSKTIIPSMERRDLFSGQMYEVVFSYASTVAVGLFVNWLYDRIKNKPSIKIKINHKEVSIDKNEIKRVIMEEIEIEEK